MDPQPLPEASPEVQCPLPSQGEREAPPPIPPKRGAGIYFQKAEPRSPAAAKPRRFPPKYIDPDNLPDVVPYLNGEVLWWPLDIAQAYIYRKTRRLLTRDWLRHMGQQGKYKFGGGPFPGSPIDSATFRRFIDHGEAWNFGKKDEKKKRRKPSGAALGKSHA